MHPSRPFFHRASFVSSLVALAVTAAATPGAAQQQDPARVGEFSVQRFESAIGANNLLTVAGARMTGNLGWTASVLFNYSRDPFIIKSCRSETDCNAPNAEQVRDVHVIQDMVTWDVMASFSPLSWMQIGTRIPLTYASGEGINTQTGLPATGGLNVFSMGDPALELKIRIPAFKPNDPAVVGIAADVAFPVARYIAPDSNLGNSTVSGGLKAILDVKVGPVTILANVKGIIREDARLATTTIGPEFRYGAGIGIQATPIFKILAEGYGATRFEQKNGTNSLEVDGGIQLAPLNTGVVVTAGGGVGVLQGAGVPIGRAIAGFMYSAEDGDKDGDGVPDRKDQCPTIPEDKDGFEDDDGCPDDDNDKDGIPDKKDKCRDVPETINGFKDDDGCPDDLPDRDKDGIRDDEDKCPDVKGVSKMPKELHGCPDKDGDKIPDAVPVGMDPSRIDKCPDEAEDYDGFQDDDGCPEPDNDMDGILDEADECSDKPEVYNGYKDEDGCPDEVPDRDKDGIPDTKDKCPDSPENYNGFEDEDGCPDKGPALVHITKDALEILQRVEFATNSDKITGNGSFKVLDAVASVLKNHGEIFLVEVGGHTDDTGDAAANKTLSQKRADAVMKYLIDKGVKAVHLTAKGYGQEKPLVPNKSAAQKQKNRRVEFTVLKSTKKNPDAVPEAPKGPAPKEPAKAPGPAKSAPAPKGPAVPAPVGPAPKK